MIDFSLPQRYFVQLGRCPGCTRGVSSFLLKDQYGYDVSPTDMEHRGFRCGRPLFLLTTSCDAVHWWPVFQQDDYNYGGIAELPPFLRQQRPELDYPYQTRYGEFDYGPGTPSQITIVPPSSERLSDEDIQRLAEKLAVVIGKENDIITKSGDAFLRFVERIFGGAFAARIQPYLSLVLGAVRFFLFYR